MWVATRSSCNLTAALMHNLISVQPSHKHAFFIYGHPCSSADPVLFSSLKSLIAAPCLWNELPTELREPRQILSPSRSPPITHGSSSSPSSLSPLSSSLTRSVFHSELKLGSLQILSVIDLFLTYRTDSTDSLPI